MFLHVSNHGQTFSSPMTNPHMSTTSHSCFRNPTSVFEPTPISDLPTPFRTILSFFPIVNACLYAFTSSVNRPLAPERISERLHTFSRPFAPFSPIFHPFSIFLTIFSRFFIVVAVQGALSSFVDSLVTRSSLPRHQLYYPCFPSSARFPFPNASIV